jgi:hypothetical protein
MTHDASFFDAVRARYSRDFSRPELLNAIRALSWRYVEARDRRERPDALGSAGKRAAFALFYGSLHFLTMREIVRALDARLSPGTRLMDLGCGTGVCSAAWATIDAGSRFLHESSRNRLPASLSAVDAHPWAVAEAQWTWRTLGVRGQVRQGNLVAAVEHIAREPRGRLPTLLFGWSVNELAPAARARVRSALVRHFARGGRALVIEPIARRLSPWWDDWAGLFRGAGGRADEWTFDVPLPDWLAELNDAAGFSERRLTARTLWLSRAGA